MFKGSKRITHFGKVWVRREVTHLSGNSNIHIQYQTKTGINGNLLYTKTADNTVNLDI